MQTKQQRQIKCEPYIKLSAHQSITWSVPKLCTAYNWPSSLPGGGVIAIVELGGGWTPSDMVEYFSSIGQPMPSITDVSVDGTNNTHQNPQSDADIEVALDIQVSAAAYYVATGQAATVRVYWAQDIGPAVQAAMKDGCDVCSISWGADEADWGPEACKIMQDIIAEATHNGMIVFAAAGDNDSSDGGPNSANVDCPASCPNVIACGGTSKTLSTETVWNNNPGVANGEGTGGGYSTVFGFTPWQADNGAPPAPKTEPGEGEPGRGRMVPDVSANADPETGYQIFAQAQSQIVGGTSAVAPLYAGLFASFGKKIGFVNKTLWENHGAFVDILKGNNGDFSAEIGPDPVSGIGAPIGVKIAKLF